MRPGGDVAKLRFTLTGQMVTVVVAERPAAFTTVSEMRYLVLPLVVFGIYVAARSDFRIACLLLVTVLYYLVPGTSAHTEIRYVLPMHGLLIVFAGLGVNGVAQKFSPRSGRKHKAWGVSPRIRSGTKGVSPL